MYKVSVIIPVFNVEEFIERCSRSLFEQSLDDIEYIFIDDCSPDNSINILQSVLKDYPNRHNQVRIITMPTNSGQAAVRKKGIEIATGEYIIHCDSDDFVDKDMYKNLYEEATKRNLDILVCDYFEGNDRGWIQKQGSSSKPTDIIIDSLLLSHIASLCNKLVRNHVVKDSKIVYPDYSMAEDLALSSQYALLASHIGYLAKPLYYYVRRDSSTLGNRTSEALLDKQRQFVSNFKIVENVIKINGLEKYYENGILHEKTFIKNYILPAVTNRRNTAIWCDTFKEVNSKVPFSSIFTIRERINFIVCLIGLYPFYNKIVHKNG